MDSGNRVVRRSLALLQEVRARCFHWQVRAGDNRAELAVFGSTLARRTWEQRYFGSDEKLLRTRPVFHFGGWRRALRDARNECGLVVANGVALPREMAADAIAVPRYVKTKTMLPDSPDAYLKSLSRAARTAVRDVGESGFSIRESREAEWADEFLRRFNAPSVRVRHSAVAVIRSPAQVREIVQHRGGGFLQLIAEETCVAALCYRVAGTVFHFECLGWLDGRDDVMKTGVVGALYWFGARHAIALGCTQIDHGGSSAYLESGLLGFKAKWGAVMVPEETTYVSDLLLLNPQRPGAREFLATHSLVAWGANRTFDIYSGRSPQEVKVRGGLTGGWSNWHQLIPPGESPAPAGLWRRGTN